MENNNEEFDWAKPREYESKKEPLTQEQIAYNTRLEEIKQQMINAGVFDLFGTKKEVKALPELLDINEIVVYATSGFVDKGTVLIVVTDKRLVFINRGMIYGTDFKEIPFDHINAVSYSKGIMLAKISITNGADTTLINNVAKETAPAFVDKLKKAISESHQAVSVSSLDNSVNNLRNLKQLLDDEIITQEDFDAKKRQILGI